MNCYFSNYYYYYPTVFIAITSRFKQIRKECFGLRSAWACVLLKFVQLRHKASVYHHMWKFMLQKLSASDTSKITTLEETENRISCILLSLFIVPKIQVKCSVMFAKVPREPTSLELSLQHSLRSNCILRYITSSYKKLLVNLRIN